MDVCAASLVGGTRWRPTLDVPIKNIKYNTKILKSIRKTLYIKMKIIRSWMCAQHQSSVVPTGDQILVLLHCAKVALDGICYENCSTFYYIVPGGKGKDLFSK